MKKVLVSTLALAIWAAAPAGAALCALDVAPARTLLLPYFEVDLTNIDKPKKTEITTVTLTNHADEETLVHVTFWTDLSQPVMAYDIPIPPFGSQDIPMHEIFSGDVKDLPGMDPDNFNIAPPGATTEIIIARQTGVESNGNCLTFPRGDGRARGYITFDVAGTNGIFANRSARSDHLNVLTGVVSYNNRKRKYGALEYLVHLEETERLPSIWAVNYDLGSGSRAELVVWRAPNSDAPLDLASVCDGPSENGWYPLDQVQVAVADQNGNMQEILVDPVTGAIPGFPLATGVYELGKGDLKLPFKSGAIYLDLSDSEESLVAVRRSFSSSKRQGRAQAISLKAIECSGDSFRSRTRRSKPEPSKRKLVTPTKPLSKRRD